LPETLLTVKDIASGQELRVIPGELRSRDVEVGRHLAISPGAVRRFLARFEQAYSGLGKTQAILSGAAAHHRFAWIHPFLDGNGRVARLMSHAMLLEQLDTGGVWSIARALARRQADYKRHLAACDMTRRNDLDGRGNLSEEALSEFTAFFLEVCIDQVVFMEQLMQPDRLRARLLLWAEEEMRAGKLPQKAGQVLVAVLYRGELPRAEVAALLGVTDRQARRIAADLSAFGIITSESSRAPWRLAFPATLAPRLMPGLFPE
jgi:Fic family protein